MAESYDLRCAHCGEPLSKRDKVCPRCGAEVKTDTTPKTIYELRQYCARRRMPLAAMRFFLGEDCKEARAFGIYQDDDGDFVVYKNKADGTRAIRYRGPDEAHAVKEIYDKLLSEIEIRKQKKRAAVQTRTAPTAPTVPTKKKRGTPLFGILTLGLVIAVSVAALFFAMTGKPSRGYYYYDDGYYYSQDGDWYYYDQDDWYLWDMPEEFVENSDDYYVGQYYDSGYGVDDFYYSDYYYEPGDSDWDDDDDWDDDSDWDDWDDWDTDWDSDW